MSGCPQSTVAHCSEQKGALVGCCSGTGVPTAAWQSTASGELHTSLEPELNRLFFSSFDGVICIYLFLRLVCFSLSETIYNISHRAGFTPVGIGVVV